MKVALVGPYPVVPGRLVGGVEAATYYLAEGLRARSDVDLTVVTISKEVEAEHETVVDGMRVHHLVEPSRRIVPNLIANVSRFRKVIDGLAPDIVHAQHPCGALAGIAGGYSTVFTIHGIIHKERRHYSRVPSVRLGVALLDHITRRSIARATHCVAVSSYVAGEYGGLLGERVSVIPNALDDRFFGVRGDEVDGRVLYVGLVSERKNVIGLVRALELVKQSCPNAELHIAGSTPDDAYRRRVAAWAAERGLADSVRFLGSLDQDQLEREHAEASVVCIFSWHETFSLTVSQGMAAGKAVVSSESGGPSDLIDDSVTGFLVPCGDEAAFAGALIRLLSDRDLRHAMGARAREVARKRYSKEAVAARTRALYDEVLSAKGEK